MWWLHVLILSVFYRGSFAASSFDEIDCKRIFKHSLTGFYPLGKSAAGNFTEHPQYSTIVECTSACCEKGNQCNVAFMFNFTCYHIKCITEELCLPVRQNNGSLQMVLVNPISLDKTWTQVLDEFQLDDDMDVEQPDEVQRKPAFSYQKYADDLLRYRNYENNDLAGFKPCEMGLRNCGLLEECVQLRPKSRQGFCTCVAGYRISIKGICVKLVDINDRLLESLRLPEFQRDFKEPDEAIASLSLLSSKIVVSVASKEVRLPEKSTTLAAYTIPDEKASGDKYKYTWTLISQPNEVASNGTISDQTKDKILLTNLSEGFYRFKVCVSGRNHSYGEAEANVTVKSKQTINKPPVVIITPKTQILKLPNSEAILDGSSSTDDSEIVSWHWDLVEGPLGYEPSLPETSTLQLLQLTNLNMPGNYTFKLTLTDSDGTQNSSKANIKVLKSTDYPPEANAVPNVMVRLPESSVILNGSMSTDDRGIVSWEWTKDLTDSTKGAVDMQDTRTPYLKLSNLEEGTYKFILKVTDASDQISNTSVLVFVKKPTIETPPVASAGPMQRIFVPQTWTVLDGTNSSDDIRITKFLWSQVDGPSRAILVLPSNGSIANATNLNVVGKYVFQLTVIDDDNMNSTDKVEVNVIQAQNLLPVADAGGDQTLTMPVAMIVLNGSRSTDDIGIVNYTWSRLDTSLAVGDIISDTQSPILMMTNVVPGKYSFKLQVTDTQNMVDEDTVRILIREDPEILNVVEVTIATEITSVSVQESNLFIQKLELILGDRMHIRLRNIRPADKRAECTIIFTVEEIDDHSTVPGITVLRDLKQKLKKDSSLISFVVTDIRTTICQNPCSGHGKCDPESRYCLCETFWITDIFAYWRFDEGNCDWSVLYVTIAVIIIIITIFSLALCGLSFLRRPKKKKSKFTSRPAKYALVDSSEDQFRNGRRNSILSESETDSDVLFEHSTQKTQNFSGKKTIKASRLGKRLKI